ncbi:MAG: phosphate signaling complex protein PhoU [Planctomycetota bacterium]
MLVDSLEADLIMLRRSLNAMAEKAEARVDAAIDAWLSNDYDLADSLRFADDEMDRLDVEVEELCQEILENHHPRGPELRYVLGAIRLTTQLERMADLARSIAKRVLKHQNTPAVLLPEPAREMGGLVRSMMRRVRLAIEGEDAAVARDVRRSDPAVDEQNRAIYAWATKALAQAPPNAELYLDVVVLVRALERIGDLCANAAEDVIFVVGGSIVRHTPIR